VNSRERCAGKVKRDRPGTEGYAMPLDENPYAPPKSADVAVGVRSGRREDLKTLALAQKAVITCIGAYFAGILARFLVPPEYLIFLLIGFLALGLTAMISVIILAMKVYNPVTGIVYGIGTIIPFFGLIILLVINTNATKILELNGHHVGFFGADLSKF
jgi:hypothetical protein